MKKIIAILMAAFVILTVSACSNDNGDTSDKQQTIHQFRPMQNHARAYMMKLLQ